MSNNYKLSLKFETGGYLEVDDFVGKAPVYVTLRYLKELYRQYGPQFDISASEIADRRKLHRTTVQSAFDILEKMRLIEILRVSKHDGTTIRFNADQYVSLASCYTELSDEDKIKFAQYLQSQNWEGLKELNFVCKKGSGRNLGTLPLKGCTFDEPVVGLKTSDVGFESSDVEMEASVVLKPTSVVSISTSIWRDLIDEYGSDALISASDVVFETSMTEKMLEGLKNGDPDLISRFPLVDFESSGCRFEDIRLSSFRHLLSVSRQLYIIEKEKRDKEIKKIEDFPIRGEEEKIFQEGQETEEGFPRMNFELSSPSNDQRTSSYIKSQSPYKNKPYFGKVEVKEFLRGFKDNLIAYPVDFFINRFWWSLWEAYKNETGFNNLEVDENGIEQESTSSETDSLIMDGLYMPLNFVMDIARNVYDDLSSYFQQGQFIDEHGTSIKFHEEITQEEIDDFDYRFIFDWDLMTDRDGVRQVKIDLCKFRDINADDAVEDKPSRKDDKILSNFQNLKFWELLRTDIDSESPLEQSLQQFIKIFCIVSTYGPIDAYTDENGQEFENRTKFPDYKLKEWCVRSRIVSYKDFTSVLAKPYRAMDGMSVGAYLFDVKKVARWNELNGYTDTIAHQALMAE